MTEKFKERRKHSRLLLSLPMRLQWVNEEGNILNKTYNSVNISTGGVYYRSEEKIPLGTDTIVTFDLPSNELVALRVLKTRGKVIRIEDDGSEQKGIALQFVDDLRFSTLYNNNNTK